MIRTVHLNDHGAVSWETPFFPSCSSPMAHRALARQLNYRRARYRQL